MKYNHLFNLFRQPGAFSFNEFPGDIVYKIGEQDYARKLWKKALKLDVTNSELKQKIEKGEI